MPTGALTPPDTWSRPFGTCICSTCWDQILFFRIFRYFFRTMLFEDPSVLSRFSYNNTFLYAHFQYLAAWCPSCILPSDFLFLTISFNKFIRIDAMLSVLSRFIQLYTNKKSVIINLNLWKNRYFIPLHPNPHFYNNKKVVYVWWTSNSLSIQ